MKPLLLTLALLHGADAATTDVALARGGREVLYPTQSPWAIDGMTAAQAYAECDLLRRLAHTRPRLAKGVAWSIIGVRTVVVTHNLRELRK